MTGRITIVTGKGGVGKTTVAAAVALNAARGDEGVVLVTADASARAIAAVRQREASEQRFRIEETDPSRLVDDALRRVVRVPFLARALLRHPAYEPLKRIAPGVKEIALLNRVARLAEGGARVVVDAPATGHLANLLDAPAKAAEVLVGAVKRRVEEIDAFYHDGDRAGIVIVTIAEEMPVSEAAELAAHLGEGGFHLHGLVVNRVAPGAGADGVGEDAPREVRLVEAVLSEQEHHLGRLVGIDAPVRRIPWIGDDEDRAEAATAALRGFAS